MAGLSKLYRRNFILQNAMLQTFNMHYVKAVSWVVGTVPQLNRLTKAANGPRLCGHLGLQGRLVSMLISAGTECGLQGTLTTQKTAPCLARWARMAGWAKY